MTIENGVISGTLNYVTDYTGFSGDVALQSGNYLVLKCTTEDPSDTITVELIGGIVGHPVTLDEDRNIVLRITDKDLQSVEVKATNGETSTTTAYALSGLTLAAE